MDAAFLRSAIFGFLLLFSSLGVNYFAGNYANAHEGNAVTDLLLDHLPVVDVDFFYIQGFAIFILFVFAVALYEPKNIPFLTKSIALFTLIRSAFITLTHIGPFPSTAPLDAGRVSGFFNFTGDLFFSGHTGVPFLLALLFWRQTFLRRFFLFASVFFAVIVLLGHYHYSIDVFAAYFITFAIYAIAKKIFPKDFQRSETTEV